MSYREADIVHEYQPFWVLKQKDTYTVFKSGITHSTSVQSFDEISLAVAYCDYLGKRYVGPMNSTKEQHMKGMEELAQEQTTAPASRRKYGAPEGTEPRKVERGAKKYSGEATKNSGGAARKRTTRVVEKPVGDDAVIEAMEENLSEAKRHSRTRKVQEPAAEAPAEKPKGKKLPPELNKLARAAERAQEVFAKAAAKHKLNEAKANVKNLEREAKECNRNSERVGVALQKAQAVLDKLTVTE
jgi:hypothetical protein